jgi:uncharacterized protein
VSALDVRDDAAHGRLVVEQDGESAELLYRAEPGRITLVHTEVPDALEGRGIGSALVRAAVARARADGSTLRPWCEFARDWIAEHPDAVEGITIDWTPPPA